MILSIYHEIVKLASQKKHYIMLIGFAFLVFLMVLIFRHIHEDLQKASGDMVKQMPFYLQLIAPDPVKLCDGLMFARFSCQILFAFLSFVKEYASHSREHASSEFIAPDRAVDQALVGLVI